MCARASIVVCSAEALALEQPVAQVLERRTQFGGRRIRLRFERGDPARHGLAAAAAGQRRQAQSREQPEMEKRSVHFVAFCWPERRFNR